MGLGNRRPNHVGKTYIACLLCEVQDTMSVLNKSSLELECGAVKYERQSIRNTKLLNEIPEFQEIPFDFEGFPWRGQYF